MHARDLSKHTVATFLTTGKAHLTAYKSASSPAQLLKAAGGLHHVLGGLLAAENKSDQKVSTAFFIESFNAAFGSLSGASRDQTRLLAALRTASLALRGLKQSRGVIKGRKFEVEIQQYSLIRRLVALKAYTEVRALAEYLMPTHIASRISLVKPSRRCQRPIYACSDLFCSQ